jgi:hypothetical protein
VEKKNTGQKCNLLMFDILHWDNVVCFVCVIEQRFGFRFDGYVYLPYMHLELIKYILFHKTRTSTRNIHYAGDVTW